MNLEYQTRPCNAVMTWKYIGCSFSSRLNTPIPPAGFWSLSSITVNERGKSIPQKAVPLLRRELQRAGFPLFCSLVIIVITMFDEGFAWLAFDCIFTQVMDVICCLPWYQKIASLACCLRFCGHGVGSKTGLRTTHCSLPLLGFIDLIDTYT